MFSHPHTGMQPPSPQNVQLVQGGWGTRSWILLGVQKGLPPSQHTHPEVWPQHGVRSRDLEAPTASGARGHRKGGIPNPSDRHPQAHPQDRMDPQPDATDPPGTPFPRVAHSVLESPHGAARLLARLREGVGVPTGPGRPHPPSQSSPFPPGIPPGSAPPSNPLPPSYVKPSVSSSLGVGGT